MYKIILPLLLFLPPDGLSLLNGALIKSDRDLTWNEAKEYCNAQGADLITMRNAVEKVSYRQSDGWIDLRREPGSFVWKWSRRNRKATSLNWESRHQAFGEDCAYYKSGEEGPRSSPCDAIRPFSCMTVSLLLVKENKTWEEAMNHCRNLQKINPRRPVDFYRNFEFDLVTLVTERNHNFARQIAGTATTDRVWTGLRFLESNWMWVTGENVEYEDIEKCPSKGACGTLPKAGNKSYEIRHCDEKRNFFCHRWDRPDPAAYMDTY